MLKRSHHTGLVGPHRASWCTVALLGAGLVGLSGHAALAETGKPAPEKRTLKAGTEGTSFESLVIEGEDRVQVEFARPQLDLQLDYRSAMSFDFGDAHEVVERVVPDLEQPFLEMSARERSPYLGRPWLQELSDGPVARFRPELDNVDRWSLQIADSRSETVRVFEGKGKPPAEIEWDGRAADGSQALPGLTYSYSLEAFDRAGNKRTFVGEGFQVPSYRAGKDGFHRMVIGGEQLGNTGSVTLTTPRVLLDAASWINQASLDDVIQITATARTFEQADALGAYVTRHLSQLVPGPESRMMVQTDVQPLAPARGAVTMLVGTGDVE